MNVVLLLVFCSLLLAGGSLLLFAHSSRQADHEHADRLSLLPIEEERSTPSKSS